jgi:ribonuclease HII
MVTVGIDEVGRGCWAGPFVVGAVILGRPIAGLKDSKALSKVQRERLAIQISAQAQAVGLGWVTPSEVDELGLTKAMMVAMQRALDQITIPFDRIIIDGNIPYLSDRYPVTALVKADSLVPAVSAASIVAKVARDQYMSEAAQRYPLYAFEKHVGYGTKLHLDMLKLHGVCDLHRLSYKPVRAILAAAA